MDTKADKDEQQIATSNEVELGVEELEQVIAPSLNPNHNETIVRDEEVDLCVEELEQVIAPSLNPNHNETFVRDTAN